MKILRISSLYILSYVLFIALFLVIAYNRTETKKENIGDLVFTERAFSHRPLFPRTLKSVDINFKGISFDISRRKPVIVKTSLDEVVRKSMLLRSEATKDSITLFLENDIEIRFSINPLEEKLSIETNIPGKNVFPEIEEVKIPLKILSSHTMEKTDLSYKIFNDQDEFHLKLNDNYTISKDNNYLILTTENKKLSTLTFSHLNARDLPIAEEWYMKHRVIKDLNMDSVISQYKDDVEEVIENNFRGIKYYPPDSTWAKPPASWDNMPDIDKVSENSAIIYLANSMNSSDYIEEYYKVLGLRKRYPQKFKGNETPYLGGIVTKGNKAISDYNRELSSYNRYINNEDSKIFTTRIKDFYFSNEKLNNKGLEEILLSKPSIDMNLDELSATLGNLLNISEKSSNKEIIVERIKEISNLIIRKISWTKSKLYLIDNSTISDQLLNFHTGLNLIKASQYETSEYVKPIGDALVDTFLSNRNYKGDVPLTFNFEDETFSEEYIPGEDVYMMLSDSSNYPHFFVKDDITIYSISEVDSNSINILNEASEIRIRVKYPFSNQSNPHAFAISGVKPYKQIYLGGRLWRPDLNFETWYIGYYYDQASEVLFFMVNSSSKEEIRITY